MKKTFCCIVIFCIISLTINSQNFQQEGYVKTLGRPEAKGVALCDVTIKIKGEHNSVKSNGDGVFTIQFQNKKNGDAYAFQEVRKVGYELNEPEVVGRQFAVSDKVRNTIVMVSTAQLHADKQRIESNAYKVAENNYKKKLALLEKEKENGTITVERYREQLQELQNGFEKYQSLINGLAEHYAHTDYDELNEKEQNINICIENGNLERADSLIQTLFDPIDVLKRNKEALEKLYGQISQAEGIIDQANDDMAAVLKQQEKDAEHLYQLYTIALARFDNEQARHYITTRAELDTLNSEWQYDAGEFVREYLADDDGALMYYTRIFNYSASDDDDDLNPWWGPAFNATGAIMLNCEEYDDAIDFFRKAAEVSIILNGEDANPDYGTTCSNIGIVYNKQGKYEQALTQFKIAANNSIQCYGDSDSEVALCYNNIGSVYNAIGDYNSAIPYLLHAMEIYQVYECDVNIAACYNNLGMAYAAQEKYKEAIDNYLKALDVWKKVYGEIHPYTATVYNNIGELCRTIEQYESAFKCYMAALSIFKTIYGEEHSNLAVCYNNIGLTYMAQEKYEQADSCFSKAKNIIQLDNIANRPLLVKINSNLGELNRLTNNYEISMAYYSHALRIAKELYTNNCIDVGMIYNNIGLIYIDQNNKTDALHYLNLAYKTLEALLPENHSYLLSIKEKIKTMQK